MKARAPLAVDVSAPKYMTPRILGFLSALLSSAALAADFAAEDPKLRPLPLDAATVIQAHQSFSDYKGGGCNKLVGSPVDLTGTGKRTDWVATTANGCGWGAATAPIWVLHWNATSYMIVLDSAGYDLTLGKGKLNGLRHLAIAAGTAGWYSQVLLKYDGSKYIETRSRHVILSDPEDCRRNRDVCPE